MRSDRLRRGCPFLLALFLGTSPAITGCGGSTESGTQVQLSEEAKAQIQSRRELYNAKAVVKKPKSPRKR